ncbi:unnamed protein product, partial [Mesorhabditis belari]|uniref:CCHC-type domain-containing protein n=1 Tax=Mesorhabditis belari TaxID=2138241 RepID=A0AAF3F903_9BILA
MQSMIFRPKLLNWKEWDSSSRYSSINVEKISQDKKGREGGFNPDFRKKETAKCILCEENSHKAVKCKKFKTSKARQEALESKGRCAKCARKGHRAKDCTEKPECYCCKKTGHTAITCFETIKALSQGGSGIKEPPPWTRRNARMNIRSYEDPERLLMVAKAIIKEPKTGKLYSLDMLMDSGAEDSFIKREIAEDLELPVIRDNIHMTVTGAGVKKFSRL